jgi:hypothetical protein
VIIGCLQVTPSCDGLAIAKPAAEDMHPETFGKFRFPSASQVLAQLWPRLQPPSRRFPDTALLITNAVLSLDSYQRFCTGSRGRSFRSEVGIPAC